MNFKNILKTVNRAFSMCVYTHIYKVIENNSLHGSLLQRFKLDVKSSKLDNCINCNAKLNYDNDGLALCKCDNYVYEIRH